MGYKHLSQALPLAVGWKGIHPTETWMRLCLCGEIGCHFDKQSNMLERSRSEPICVRAATGPVLYRSAHTEHRWNQLCRVVGFDCCRRRLRKTLHDGSNVNAMSFLKPEEASRYTLNVLLLKKIETHPQGSSDLLNYREKRPF